jgi:hypothetical protein
MVLIAFLATCPWSEMVVAVFFFVLGISVHGIASRVLPSRRK